MRVRFKKLMKERFLNRIGVHTTSPPQQHPHRDTLASGGVALQALSNRTNPLSPPAEAHYA